MAAAPRKYAANFSGFFFALAGICEGSGALLRGLRARIGAGLPRPESRVAARGFAL